MLENSIPIDVSYYLENQISKPLMRIFEPIIGSRVSELLKGDHTRTKTIVTSKVGALTAFCKRMEKCLGCKTLLKKDNADSLEAAVCNFCKKDESKILQLHMDRVKEMEVRLARMWTECQRCQGSVQDKVICTSRDCPIFYMRQRATKVITAQEAIIKRFGLPEW